MQVNHFFSTMSSPRPFSSVWNRCVCVFTIPGITMRPLQSTTSAAGKRFSRSLRVLTATIRSFSTHTLALSSTSRCSFIVISHASAKMMLIENLPIR